MKINKIISRITFIPWYLYKTIVLHKKIDLYRLYRYGYCSKIQYKICKNIGRMNNDLNL